MSVVRAAGAVGSFGVALMLLFQFARALRPVVLPTLRQLGQEPTTYFVLRIAGLSFSGWRILVLEGIVLLLGVGLILFAVYVLASAKPTA